MNTVVLYGKRSSSAELGKFAQQIEEYFQNDSQYMVIQPHKLNSINDPVLTAALYASRSDEQLAEAIALCNKHSVPLIMLATNLDTQIATYDAQCKIITIPNSSLEVSDYIKAVADFWQHHKEWTVSIVEYHQSSKADVSSTAIKIARLISVDPAHITSVRDDIVAQKKFNISEKHIRSYAVHQVSFINPSTETVALFEITVLGHRTYLEGIKSLLVAPHQSNLT